MTQLYSNFSSGLLAVTFADTDNTLSLEAGQGASFPSPTGSDYFVATVEDTAGNIEIIEVDGRTTDALSVSQRGLEGTSAQTFAPGSRVEIRLTAASISSFLTADAMFAQGNLNMNNNDITNCDDLAVATISGGPIVTGATIRATDNGTANELKVPNAGADPTIGANLIFHEGHVPTPAEVGAATAVHVHAGEDITSGTLAEERLPTLTTLAARRALLNLPRKQITDPIYAAVADDLYTKLRYNLDDVDGTINVDSTIGEVGDLLFITHNANNSELTVAITNGFFLLADGVTRTNFRVLEKFAVVGLHKINASPGSWEVTGNFAI